MNLQIVHGVCCTGLGPRISGMRWGLDEEDVRGDRVLYVEERRSTKGRLSVIFDYRMSFGRWWSGVSVE